MSTTARVYTDPEAFAEAAEATLAAQPLRTSIIATTLARTLNYGPRPTDRWWLVTDAEQVIGLAMLTRTGRPYLAADSAHGPAVGAAVAADLLRDPTAEPITGVNGFTSAARAFAQEWVRAHSGSVRAGRQDVLYELPGPVRAPHDVPGSARAATDADREFLREWGRAFIRDIGDPPDPNVSMDQPLAEGGVMIWEVDDSPAAMAFASPAAYGHTRISWVWTRPELRGHGFGAAITAAVSSRAQQQGQRCLLIADSRNAVSSAMYRKLGYQVIDEACHLHFEPA